MKIMKKFMDWYQGNNDRETEPPRGGIRRVGYVLLNYSGKLVVVNLLFLLCCIPVVTIPSAVTALNVFVGKLFRTGYGVELSDYFAEFRTGLLKRLPLGVLSGFLGFYAYYLLSLANNFRGNGQADILTGMGIAVAAVAMVLGAWLFILASMLELPCRHLIRNACILMAVEWKSSLLVLLEVVLFWECVLLFAPWTLLPFLLAGPVLCQLLVCSVLIPAVKRRVVEPYEARMGRKE